MGSKSEKIPVPVYYMTIHFGICHGPVDALKGIYYGEKPAWTGNVTTNDTIEIEQPNLFGGYQKEGGVDGQVDVMFGGAGQVVSDLLAKKLGRTSGLDCPGFRGITSVLLRKGNAGCYLAAGNPYLKTFWFNVVRVPRSLGEANATITQDSGIVDANPAHIIYECLTNTDWGMGADPSDVDVASFVTVAQVMVNEGFGLSMIWNQSGTIEAFVNEVLSHINGSIFTHPRTGKITIRLLRDDYDVATLREIVPDNARVTSFSRKAWGETTNEMKVTWTNPTNEKEESVYSQDLGNIAMQGQVVSDSRNYFGVRNSSLAQKLCDRELRSASAPLCSMEVTVNRAFWDVTPLECVKVNWPEYGISGLVMRVMKVNYGRTGDSAIRLSLIEDLFSLPAASFVAPPGTSWVDPNVPPQPITAARIMPLPSYMVVKEGGDLTEYDYPETGVAVIAANPVNSGTSSFDVLLQETTPSGGTAWVTELQQLPFIGRGELAGALTLSATSLVPPLANGNRATVAVDAFLLIGGAGANMNQMELALVTSVDGSGVATVKRGVLDTIPRPWAAGTPVWVIYLDSLQAVGTLFTHGQSLSAKLLTNTTLGSTPTSSSPVFTETLGARAVLPLRPANVQINAEYWPDVIESPTGSLTITWNRRNRLLEDNVVLGWTEADVTPEVGTTHTVQLYRVDTNALVVETTGVAGTSASLTSTYGGMVRLRLTAVRDGLDSYQPFEHVFELITSELLVTEEDADELVTESGEVIILEN